MIFGLLRSQPNLRAARIILSCRLGCVGEEWVALHRSVESGYMTVGVLITQPNIVLSVGWVASARSVALANAFSLAG